MVCSVLWRVLILSGYTRSFCYGVNRLDHIKIIFLGPLVRFLSHMFSGDEVIACLISTASLYSGGAVENVT